MEVILALLNKPGCSPWAWLLIVLYASFLLIFLIGIWNLIGVVRPRLETKTERESPFYFRTISEMEVTNFKRQMKSFTYEQAVDELDDQTWVNAEIALNKFKKIETGITALVWGGILGLSVILVVHFLAPLLI